MAVNGGARLRRLCDQQAALQTKIDAEMTKQNEKTMTAVPQLMEENAIKLADLGVLPKRAAEKAAKKVVETPRAKPFAKYFDPVSGKIDMNWSNAAHRVRSPKKAWQVPKFPEGAM